MDTITDEQRQLDVVRTYVKFFERLRKHSLSMGEWWLFGLCVESSMRASCIRDVSAIFDGLAVV